MYNTKQKEEQMGEDEGDFGISTEGRVGNFIASESRAHNCKIKQSKATTNYLIFEKPSSITRRPRSPHSNCIEERPISDTLYAGGRSNGSPRLQRLMQTGSDASAPGA